MASVRCRECHQATEKGPFQVTICHRLVQKIRLHRVSEEIILFLVTLGSGSINLLTPSDHDSEAASGILEETVSTR